MHTSSTNRAQWGGERGWGVGINDSGGDSGAPAALARPLEIEILGCLSFKIIGADYFE